MTRTLRVGLVGAGFIGGVHARSIRAAGAELVAVAASTALGAQAAARRLGISRVFERALDLATADGIDVVHVAAPNDAHLPLTLAALAAGKHVVCEKPLARSVAEATQMAAAATAAGLLGAIPFVNRFHPMAREARHRVQAGRFGTVTTIHGSYLQDWLLGERQTNWRVDSDRGGPSRAFADIGSHWVDLAEWLTGCRIAELVATTATTVARRPEAVGPTFSAHPPADGQFQPSATRDVRNEDVACVLFRTSSGATGSVVVSQVAPGRKNRLLIEIDGDQRSFVFNQEQAEQLRVGTAASTEVLRRDPITLSDPAQPYAVLPAGHPQGFQDCFDSFVRDTYRSITDSAVVDGLPTFEDGLRAAHIAEAVLLSAAKGSWIEV